MGRLRTFSVGSRAGRGQRECANGSQGVPKRPKSPTKECPASKKRGQKLPVWAWWALVVRPGAGYGPQSHPLEPLGPLSPLEEPLLIPTGGRVSATQKEALGVPVPPSPSQSLPVPQSSPYWSWDGTCSLACVSGPSRARGASAPKSSRRPWVPEPAGSRYLDALDALRPGRERAGKGIARMSWHDGGPSMLISAAKKINGKSAEMKPRCKARMPPCPTRFKLYVRISHAQYEST